MKFFLSMLLAAICSIATAVTFNLDNIPAFLVGVAWGCIWAFICSCFFD